MVLVPMMWQVEVTVINTIVLLIMNDRLLAEFLNPRQQSTLIFLLTN